MRIAGRGSRTIGRWSVVAALVLVLGTTEDQLRCSPCDVAFDGRAWNRVVAACRDPRWGGRERLGRAWLAWEEQGPDEALAMAERLLDTDVAADAAYLVGYILFNRESFNEDRVRQLLYQALAEYRRTGRHADASRAAGLLARVPRPETRFDDQLTLSQQAVDEAEQSDDAGALGRALGTLAESYDVIGMEDAARTNFLDAERLTAPWPDERAHIYFKHAVFLLDLGTPQGLEASLSLFGRAAKECAKAVTKDLAKRVESLALAIRLNRADALSQLDRLGDADRELEAAGHDLGASPDVDELARIRLVRGYVAARRHDLGTAEALFRQVDGGALGGDYRARIALELARTYRNSRHLDQAESRYRNAIDIIEEVRKQTNKVELRPWVLARRTLPYVELLELLVAQDRAVDALVIAESLHARAWQDVVLGQRTDDRAATAQALTAARIRQSLHAAPTRPLDAAALMATIGDREALVFFAIGPATWRVHVVHGLVHFERLPDDAVEVANRFLLDPDDPAAVERASGVLLPADLAVSESPLYVVANGALAEVPFAALRARGRVRRPDPARSSGRSRPRPAVAARRNGCARRCASARGSRMACRRPRRSRSGSASRRPAGTGSRSASTSGAARCRGRRGCSSHGA